MQRCIYTSHHTTKLAVILQVSVHLQLSLHQGAVRENSQIKPNCFQHDCPTFAFVLTALAFVPFFNNTSTIILFIIYYAEIKLIIPNQPLSSALELTSVSSPELPGPLHTCCSFLSSLTHIQAQMLCFSLSSFTLITCFVFMFSSVCHLHVYLGSTYLSTCTC